MTVPDASGGRPTRRTLARLLVLAVLSAVVGVALGPLGVVRRDGGTWSFAGPDAIGLPAPREESAVSVEAAIADRRSRRNYGGGPLSKADLGQVLWAAQGVTARLEGYRTAPSAGALYPLELYVVVGSPGVEDLESGIYRYRPGNHALTRERSGDVQSALQEAAIDQESVGEAAVDVVVFGVDERTTGKYGERGERRYVPMETGHAGENVYLQAESLGLATVCVGAFGDGAVSDLLDAPDDWRPLAIYPIGQRA